MKYRCPWCGKEVDLDSDEANWYENQVEEIQGDELVVVGKVQHTDGVCKGVTLLTFRGKLFSTQKRI